MIAKFPSTRTVNRLFTGMLYVLAKFEERGYKMADYHTVFKTMYKADQKSLSKNGYSIFGDTYIAMKYGPVPSVGRDLIEKSGAKYNGKDKKDVFAFETIDDIPYMSAKVEPDLDHLSDLDLEYLDEAIESMANIGIGPKHFAKRTDQSHGTAWENAYFKPGSKGNVILGEDIITEGGGSKEIAQSFVERQELLEAIIE